MVENWKKELKKISKSGRTNIENLINKILLGYFDGLDITKTQGNDDLYRCRSGKYRVIFYIKQLSVIIVKVGNRGDIYKGL
ncbi:MAG: hypothetical protein M0P94_04260 [Candidatus Absconditabacterales bacterium]|nr:hypothetical protein [Candidatus Absconditabacterales bacterium]